MVVDDMWWTTWWCRTLVVHDMVFMAYSMPVQACRSDGLGVLGNEETPLDCMGAGIDTLDLLGG
jgi:hypothetical protein